MLRVKKRTLILYPFVVFTFGHAIESIKEFGCVSLMMNKLILNTLNDDSFYINNLIMKTFVQLFIKNNAFIMNNELLKLNTWTN